MKIWTGKRRTATTTPAPRAGHPGLISPITKALQSSGQLHSRPETYLEYLYASLGDSTYKPYYVHECSVATPVLVPRKPALDDGPPIKVWVSDPVEVHGKYHEFQFVGSFLFLVQGGGPEFHAAGSWSGVSALRFIVQSLATPYPSTDERLNDLCSAPDIFGRDSSVHPLDKLRRVGATVGYHRRIETIYRIAYMTNEQSYTPPGLRHGVRVNDICGYPLYVAVT